MAVCCSHPLSENRYKLTSSADKGMVQRNMSRIKCVRKILEGGVDAQHCTGADTRHGGLQPVAQLDTGEKRCGCAELYQATVSP